MQLKKIILKGFKSFPEKTVLEFNQGVTAIVGPNGSGKSNIIEAIRWVMGEQSAKNLRGGRMHDVIFSGTSELKPLNIAEVELILDNSDQYLDIGYEEVSILRRLSRSEGSTYMINQQECLLRDVVDLFMDSGLGKESFSVISQGQVEAVFNSKPEDRRSIFEEAAGVYKYKVRKEEAEKKLEQTQENLDRVQDILYELDAQLGPLKKQADTAKIFLSNKEKLTELDIAVTVWQINSLLEKIKFDQIKNEKTSKELENTMLKIKNIENDQTIKENELKEIESIREELNSQLLNVVREKERAEAKLTLFDEKERHQEVFITEKNNVIKELTTRKEQFESELKKIEQKHLEASNKLDTNKAHIQDLKNKYDLLEGDKETQIDELRDQYIHLLQQQTSLKNDRNYQQQELVRNKNKYKKLLDSCEKLEKNLNNQKQEQEEKEIEYNQINDNLEELLINYKKVEKNAKQNEEQITIQKNKITRLSQKLERSRAKKTSLLEMKENYAGYYAGVRTVMQDKDQLNGIVGTVAELINIPSPYMIAIDTALGSNSQFIIVENEKSGREAITYLKNNKKGRATFLPQTIIQPRNISKNIKNKIEQNPGYVGVASDLVQNHSKIQNIVENLLGQTIIAQTLKDANEIARLINYRNRVVSLEGDVINAGGSMTGGGKRNNTTPLFSQKLELDSLEGFISENKPYLNKLTNHQNELELKQAKYENEIQYIREQGEEKRLTQQQLKNELANFSDELKRTKRELKVTKFEISDIEKQYKTEKQDFKKIEVSISKIDKEINDCNEHMDLLNLEKENLSDEKIKINEEIQNLIDISNGIREKLATYRTNTEHYKQQIAENMKQIEKNKEDISIFNRDLEIESKDQLQLSIKKYEERELSIDEKQIKSRKEANELNADLDQYKKKLTKLSTENSNLSKEKSTLDIQITKNNVRMDHNLNYLVEEYKISFEEARLLEVPDISLKEAEEKVKELKKLINELGPVNLNSIEEYESISKRHNFLTTQQSDLITAKNNLFDTMNTMDTIVEEQFEKTFLQIKEQFSKVFPKMFGGGHAKLVLEDPENLLETGIEIIAQPPGKKLTNLSLLSGGERALTAISLLFAIIQVNPIPFCILDEAEAALDDANVIRFGKYLQNFEDNTQFIVITHRKGTMEHSDQLYGVTMQEKGVSKIVSVTLKDAQNIDGVI